MKELLIMKVSQQNYSAWNHACMHEKETKNIKKYLFEDKPTGVEFYSTVL